MNGDGSIDGATVTLIIKFGFPANSVGRRGWSLAAPPAGVADGSTRGACVGRAQSKGEQGRGKREGKEGTRKPTEGGRETHTVVALWGGSGAHSWAQGPPGARAPRIRRRGPCHRTRRSQSAMKQGEKGFSPSLHPMLTAFPPPKKPNSKAQGSRTLDSGMGNLAPCTPLPAMPPSPSILPPLLSGLHHQRSANPNPYPKP